MYKKLLKVTYTMVIVGLFFAYLGNSYAQEAHDYQYYFDLYDIKVVSNPAIDIAFPSWAKPNPEQNITDLNHRVDILPTDNRDAEKYLVYPEHGVAMPVLEPDYKDKQLIANGQMFDHYDYLKHGALHYYGDGPDYSASNMVIAAHSSFTKNGDPYNTVMQVAPISRAGDNVFLYIKNDAGSYDFYKYTIQKSFETDADNTSILRETPGKYQLTTYGCYAIGDNATRWVNTAELSQKQLAHSDLRMHAAAPEILPKLVKETTQTEKTTASTTLSDIKAKIMANIAKIHTPLIATTTSIKSDTTASTTMPSTRTSTTKMASSSKKQAIYEMLKARNQYVIADTLPASILQNKILARIQKAPDAMVGSFNYNNYTITFYKVLVAKAKKDPSLIEKVSNKLESLIEKIAGIAGKEKQYAVMKKLYESLEPYQNKVHTSAPTAETEDSIITLEDGRRFRPK